MIRLEAIRATNIRDILALEMTEDQKDFVACMAAGTDCSAFPFAIFDDKTPVGFLMIGYNEAAPYALYGDKSNELPAVLKL